MFNFTNALLFVGLILLIVLLVNGILYTMLLSVRLWLDNPRRLVIILIILFLSFIYGGFITGT